MPLPRRSSFLLPLALVFYTLTGANAQSRPPQPPLSETPLSSEIRPPGLHRPEMYASRPGELSEALKQRETELARTPPRGVVPLSQQVIRPSLGKGAQ